MKSKSAADMLHYNACHVYDGVLEDGLRVGCDDLVYMSAAIDAVEKAEEELKQRVIECHRLSCHFLAAKLCFNKNENQYREACNLECEYMSEFENYL